MFTFENALPEETGIPTDCISHFVERLKIRHIPMHSLLIMHHDKLIFEGYYDPCRADTLHRMFSISKSFTSIAIGLLVDEGKISMDDPIIKYFPEKLPPNVHPWIASMTIRNMLMMRTCHASTTYKLNMASDWVDSFFTTPPTHPAGTIFHYDTSAAHTLCALVEKLTGENMLDYIKKKLDVLGLSENSYMLKDPFGVSIGGSGLVALSTDLMRFGYFIAHKGMVDGKQLISSSYIELATSCLTETQITAPLPSEAQGYGLQFWRGEKNGYTCYGMGGQLIIFLPDYDLICVTTADTQSIGGGNQQIYDALYEEILPYIQDEPLPVTKGSVKLLNDVLSSLKIEELSSLPMPGSAAAIIGKDFRVITENSQFDSFCLNIDTNVINQSQSNNTENNIDPQGQYSNPPQSGTLSFVYKNTACTVNFGIGCMKTGIFPIYDLKYCASGAWLADGTFYIKVHIIDSYVGIVYFQLSFGKDDLTIFMRKKEESLFKEFEGHLYCKS